MEQQALSSLPFYDYDWQNLDVYYGHFGQDENVEFSMKDAVVVHKYTNAILWLILLEASPGGGNDAILQRTALVKVQNNGTYIVYENNMILENAGGGGPYDWTIDRLKVDGNIVAGVVGSRDIPITIDTDSFSVGLRAFIDPKRL